MIDDRMFRLLVGVSDASQNMRQEHLSEGIEDLSNNWLLGSFMGDVQDNFGKSGKYIHNYLSFWRQFGLVPFIGFFIILVIKVSSISIIWLRDKKNDPVKQFLFCFTIFSLIEILIARSYICPYIWLSISGISMLTDSKKEEI